MTPQPNPELNDRPAIWALVMADMQARDAFGRSKYGIPLQPFNGRDALVDAYQEALDLCVYLRQAIWERDEKRTDSIEELPTIAQMSGLVDDFTEGKSLREYMEDIRDE